MQNVTRSGPDEKALSILQILIAKEIHYTSF